jgi:hypothetical protein
MAEAKSSKFDQFFKPIKTESGELAATIKQEKDTELKQLYGEVEKKYGPDSAEGLKSTFEQMEVALLRLSVDDNTPTSLDLPQILRDLSNSLYGRVSSNNLTPDNAITALKGANAMAAVEPLGIFQDGAQEIVDGLNRRYGVTPKP